MIIEIYDEPREEVEKVVRLKLETRGNHVALMAVDTEGNRALQGDILTITAEGVRMSPGISALIGLPILYGHVKVI